MEQEVATSAECERSDKPAAPGAADTLVPFDNRIQVLILQHPQEQDRALGTAHLTVRHFRHAILKVGLSWPSLAKILGRPADPQRWAVLYLGSAKAAALAPGREVVLLNRKGEPEPNQDPLLRDIEGVVLLDGNWSQAKALWWRNAWMLKCRRVILGPRRPSRYGRHAGEPAGEPARGRGSAHGEFRETAGELSRRTKARVGPAQSICLPYRPMR
jgi:DTW domain-containing protein